MAGEGYGTFVWPLDELEIQDCDVYVQWWVDDPTAVDATAKSPIAHIRMIPYLCGGDMNCDGIVNGVDVQDFVQAVLEPQSFAASHIGCDARNGDFNGDNLVNSEDVLLFTEALILGG